MVSFKSIATHSHCVDENEFFEHYFDPDALFRYDSNFFQLKYSPTKEEFLLIEDMQEFFAIQNGLEHIKFYWPQDEGIRVDTLDYLNEKIMDLKNWNFIPLILRVISGKRKIQILRLKLLNLFV
ncbi:DUF5613 domain-containing protein [Alkalibacterium kapii]|uniref:DUF5613 domain-containing protein n=1 Tax=Alkalibacterium kapii TaxID=426704 RepID=A0A511AT50_9LACT|nr:DUF5613 domain-containing protein [Alkalibacterium kapii]GEK91378.1 hypothetical protein AKA01nite_10000 [Alkalibacterium kapii]